MIAKQRLLTSVFVGLWALCGAVLAADRSVTITVDGAQDVQTLADGTLNATVQAQESFDLVITINSPSRAVQTIDGEPGLERLQILGESQEQSTQTINGDVSSTVKRILHVRAPEEGTITIGPVSVQQNGASVTSNMLVLKAVKQAPAAQGQSGAKAATDKNDSIVVCKLTADRKEAVVGEPIVVTLKISSRGNIAGQISLGKADSDGFITKEVINVKQQSQVQNDVPYEAMEKKFVFIPQRAGSLEIKPMQLTYAVHGIKKGRGHPFDSPFFDQFFGNHVEQRQVTTDAIPITVINPPATKKPLDGVGEFTGFQATLSKDEIEPNEPITLTITLEGKAYLEQIALPKLSLPGGFRYYESKTDIQEDLANGYNGGTKRFESIVQATRPGTWTIPAQTFTYFDTVSRSIKQLSTQPLALTVTSPHGGAVDSAPTQPAANDQTPESQVNEKPAQEVVPIATKQDINFIEEEGTAQKTTRRALPLWLLLLCVALVPLVFFRRYLLGLFKPLWHKRFAPKVSSSRQLSAYEKRLATIVQHGDARSLYHFFIQFLAAIYDQSSDTITEDFIEEQLLARGWEREKINEYLTYVAQCARLHFTPQAAQKTDQEALLKKAHYWLLMLNK